MAVFWMWSGFVMIRGGIAGLFQSYKKLSHDSQFHSLLPLLPPLVDTPTPQPAFVKENPSSEIA